MPSYEAVAAGVCALLVLALLVSYLLYRAGVIPLDQLDDYENFVMKRLERRVKRIEKRAAKRERESMTWRQRLDKEEGEK